MTIILLLLGATPFLFGGIVNWYVMQHLDASLPFEVIGIVFLAYWGLLAFLFSRKGIQTKRVVLLLNFVAAIVLVLLGIQEIVFHDYWADSIGIWTQFFYLPVLRIGAIFYRLLAPLSGNMYLIDIFSFILMVAASYVGCKASEKKNK